MNIEYKDFLGIYQNVYPDGYCQHLINDFERLSDLGCGYNRKMSENSPKHRKNDFQMELNYGDINVTDFDGTSSRQLFFKGLQNCYDDYVSNFSILEQRKINATHIKMQRTDPGGGYHLWHSEKENDPLCLSRVLVYMLYLNDFDEQDGGETEFLYQKLRLKPKQNTMLIWPAEFTYTHRGNMVLGNKSKYIATGWFYYA